MTTDERNQLLQKYFDRSNRRIIIDKELCRLCSISNDNWGRQAVTPFAVACYVYHAIHTLRRSPESVFQALVRKWDSIIWRGSGISLGTWNRLFNGSYILPEEWTSICLPFGFISEIKTSVTTPTSKKICYPMVFSYGNITPGKLFICTEESYRKTVVEGRAVKVTAYEYGKATDMRNIYEGLRNEVLKAVIPF